MTLLVTVLHELAGLFVDDGALALAILGVVVLAAIVAAFMPSLPITAGVVLLLGCLCMLVANVMKAARR